MRDDTPTVPGVRQYGMGERQPGETPSWPVARERGPRRASNYTISLVLGASLGGNVALIAILVGVLALARAGYFVPPRSSAQSGAHGVATGTALSQSSPTPLSGALQVVPSNVQLGCGDGQLTQFAVLENAGSDDVSWQMTLDVPADQAGVSVRPTHGDLKAGTSVVLQIQNRTSGADVQGVIHFETTSSSSATAAGGSANLSYTSTSCQ